MVNLSLRTTSSPNRDAARSNYLYVSAADYAKLGGTDKILYILVRNTVFVAKPHDAVQVGMIAFNGVHRKNLQLSTNEAVDVKVFELPTENFCLSSISFSVDFPTKGSQRSDAIDAVALAAHVKKALDAHVISIGQEVLVDFQSIDLSIRAMEIQVLKVDSLAEASAPERAR
jgi:hypothetical protein